MKVFVYAYEGMYQGLHGIEDLDVLEVSDNLEEAEKEIDDWGREASEELIYSYGLEDEYCDAENEKNEDDEWDITESTCYCDRGWYAHKVRDDVTLSLSELREACCNDGKNIFVKEYCEQEVLF